MKKKFTFLQPETVQELLTKIGKLKKNTVHTVKKIN